MPSRCLFYKKNLHTHTSVVTSRDGDPTSCQGNPWVNMALGEKIRSGFAGLASLAAAGLRSRMTQQDKALSSAASRAPAPV